MTLIVPIAGQSSRFPGVRPKWMLTHPNGKFMVCEAIAGINPDVFENIIFAYLQEHEDIYKFRKGLEEELEDLGLMAKVKFIALDKPTKDQAETVYQSIILGSIKGPICIKDSDNNFKVNLINDNYVCYHDLNNAGLIKPQNKSYVLINDHGIITNIIEKQVISPFFCVGAYGFRDAQLFIDSCDKIVSLSEKYISNVIYQCILDGEQFRGLPVNGYLDWGTLEDWEKFKRTFATLFIDLDGVLVEHSSCHFPPYYGTTQQLTENASIINKLTQSGKFEIIITTSRPEKYRQLTIKQLDEIGIKYNQLIMQLQHNKRIVINDYSKSNPYKSCDSINLKRNSQDLKDILRDAIGVDYEEIY